MFNTVLLVTFGEWFKEISPLLIQGVQRIGLALIILVVGFWLAKRFSMMIGALMKAQNLDKTLRPFIVSIVGVGLKIFVLITAAGTLGIETTSFAAALGAAFLAIGMALQGSLGNFAGGFLILVFRPFKVGDLIESLGYTGHVKEIQIFNTILVTLGGETIILPNGQVSNSPIKNISTTGSVRVDLTIGVGYEVSIDKAREVIMSVSENCPLIPKTRPTEIFVRELADSSVNFAVRPWVDPANFWAVNFYMHEHIKKAFDKEGINIPYPHLNIINKTK